MLLLAYLILLEIKQSQINFKRIFLNKSNIFKLLASLALPLGLGAIAGLFTADAVP
jgi:hypothetical protein